MIHFDVSLLSGGNFGLLLPAPTSAAWRTGGGGDPMGVAKVRELNHSHPN